MKFKFYLTPSVAHALSRVTPPFYRNGHDDKPILVDPDEELPCYSYSQYEIADIFSLPQDLRTSYCEILKCASDLMHRHGRRLGNVWLRAQRYEEPVSFGQHTDPSYLTLPICKGHKPSGGFGWYGELARELDSEMPLLHTFNPNKDASDVITWVAFVYPALTTQLPEGGTVADYLNNLES